jgi:ribosome-associated protein
VEQQPSTEDQGRLSLAGDHITLVKALKAAGLVGSGGQAKHLVRSGAVKVNDVVETQPGRKLFSGDRFQVADEAVWTVSR